MSSPQTRRVQKPDSTHVLSPHWGYAPRVLPCANDAPGSCEYIDAVYWQHDLSMLFTVILWAVIGSGFMIVVGLRLIKPYPRNRVRGGQKLGCSRWHCRVWGVSRSFFSRWLLPESLGLVFGHVTRLQVLVLAILTAYTVVFSFIGIGYKNWITPSKSSTIEIYNERSSRVGLGGFADRVGALAYALTPFAVALSTRESILTLITGIPYQSFNFLHRWLGRIIFIQAFVHTLGWTWVYARVFQPQPSTYQNFIKETYMIWGCIAMVLISFLYVFSLRRVIAWTGHEFFRKTHYVVAMLYVFSCWGHWTRLKCWMIASLTVWGLDRCLRLLRTLLIHTGYLNKSKSFGFHPAQALMSYFEDDDGGVVRLEFDHDRGSWEIGQHFYLCFPALTIWQSHPMTVASLPDASKAHHTYIIRSRNGETERLKALALAQSREASHETICDTTPVILCGPYGTGLFPSNASSHQEVTNILAIAGGTGVSLTLPLVLAATSQPAFQNAAVDFTWIIRRSSNMQWIDTELEELKYRASNAKFVNFNIQIFITQEQEQHDEKFKNIETETISDSETFMSSSESDFGSSNFEITYLGSEHPSLDAIVSEFIRMRAIYDCRTRVIASGPAGMGRDLRAAVAGLNDGRRIWKGDKRWDINLFWDSRSG